MRVRRGSIPTTTLADGSRVLGEWTDTVAPDAAALRGTVWEANDGSGERLRVVGVIEGGEQAELVLQPVPFGASISAPADALAEHFHPISPEVEAAMARSEAVTKRLAELSLDAEATR